MVQDEEGRWWAKHRETGKWNYYDGSTWVQDTPPGYEGVAPEPTTDGSPTQHLATPHLETEGAEYRRRRRPWVLAVGLVGVLAVVGLGVVAWLQVSPIAGEHQALKVPLLEGQKLEAARQEVGEDFELVSSGESSRQPEGVIISQDPNAGTQRRRGETISVVVSTGPETAQVPDVVGELRGEAKDILKSNGFEVAVKIRESSEEDVGKVVEQSPSGEVAKKGSEVAITVGQAPKPTPGYSLVEDVSGRLTMEVPSGWEIMPSENLTLKVADTAGNVIDQETPIAVINAAPDLDNWQHSAAGAGTSLMVVEELAQSYTNDELIDGIPALSANFADCSPGTRENLSRASYSGRVQRWHDCYAHTPSYVTLAAAPKSRECAVVGQIGMITEADRKAAQNILDTFEVDCGASARIGPESRTTAEVAGTDDRFAPG
jgi:hypothetical protein